VTSAESERERSDETAERVGEPQETAAPGRGGPDVEGEGEDMPRDLSGDSPTDLLNDLAVAQQALNERTADLQRLQAEYVNYKRRVDRDRELVRENAVYASLTPMLPVLDDLDRAREHGELEGGFKAVADSLERIVSGLGLVKFGAPGDEFDPNLHEALMHSHSPEVTKTTCQNIIQAGYRIGSRVVRAARVTVVDPEPAPAGPAAGGTSDGSTDVTQ